MVNKIQQIDEPKKVKVKPFIADWFEEHKDFLELSLGRITPDIRTKIVQGQALSEFEKWFNNTRNKPFETIIRMKNGYEIEEERKFEVIFPNLTGEKDLYLMKFYEKLSITSDRNFYVDQRYIFTEKEIKSIDERYWQFAVPVEKV